MRRPHLALAITSLLLAQSAMGTAFTLNNGPGDGSVTVGVDAYGSFGSAVFGDTTDLSYDPVGPGGPSGTTFQSGVAIRLDGSATSFLTTGSIGGSGSLAPFSVTGTQLAASSTFTYGALSFSLSQKLVPLQVGGTQTGTLLVQTYDVTNTSQSMLDFQLLRYLDGDLLFNGSLIDGGGRLVLDGEEILFEIDSATGAATPTTFIGITATGGGIPSAGRYDIDYYGALRSRILDGKPLNDLIVGDGPDADQFIDANNGYDVALALMNNFSLGGGATAQYVTSTYFGSGRPDTAHGEVPPAPMPLPGTLALLGLGLGFLMLFRR